MREEGRSSEEKMGFPSGKSFESVEEGLIDLLGAKLIDEMIIVDAHLFANAIAKEKSRMMVNTLCYRFHSSHTTTS